MKKKKDIPDMLRKLEEEIRSLRTELKESRDTAVEELPEPLAVLIGMVRDLTVAIPVDLVLEVLPRVFLNPIPESPGYLAGYLQWRGNPVPVIDPAARWGEPPLPVRLEDRIVVFSQPEGPRALLLTQVDEIIRLSKAGLGSIPSELPASPYALAFWYSTERNVLLLAPERLVDAAELAKYATF